MRVLTFLHSFEPGGVERIALRLVRRWRETGVDAPLFMGRRDGAMADDVGAGLSFDVPPQPPFGTAWWESLWMIVQLPFAVRAARPDAIFCAGNTYTVAAAALKLLLGRRCPPIVVKVSNDLGGRYRVRLIQRAYRLWLRLQGRLLDHFVGLADPMAAEIVEALDIPAARVSVIADPALSNDLIDRLRRPRQCRPSEAGRRFVAVGRLAPQKNLPLMLRAFAAAAGPDDQLTLIGDGPERPKLEQRAADLGLGQRVLFRGYVPDPPAMMRDFDVLLLSSDYEAVPAVILEALAAGMAIVATDCSRSMRSLLGDGALGTLVPVGDEAQLAAAIRDIAPGQRDPDAARQLAAGFTIETAAQAYLDLMAKLTGLPAPALPAKGESTGGHHAASRSPEAMAQ